MIMINKYGPTILKKVAVKGLNSLRRKAKGIGQDIALVHAVF